MCEETDSRCTTTVAARGTRLKISGLSRFLLPTFLCGRQRKVGAAPHRGNANRPIRKQGKANAGRATTRKSPTRPIRNQGKANAGRATTQRPKETANRARRGQRRGNDRPQTPYRPGKK